jgi:pteridine reductase
MTRGEARVALVTGGARRIGAAVSRKLAAAGFRVAFTFRASRAEAKALAAEIGGETFRLDLGRPEAFPHLAAAAARRFGRLDLLVHNAALFSRTPVGRITAREWDAVFAVNLRGPFLLTQALLPLLSRTRRSGVLFIGDAGAPSLWPAYIPYCLSKLALEDQVRAWRKVLSPAVRVGLVRPGLALIPDGFPRGRWEALRARGDPRRLDSPARVAGAVLRFARAGGYNSH